jgi:succinate dehydrogenase / fumarate reductase, cytochrome b subunit
MNKAAYICSTIGRKQLMAVAGLLLCGFVLAHAAGNMFILAGPDAYNKYGHAIISNPFLYVAEAGLVLFFLVHIFMGVAVTIKNFSARPKGYAVSSSGEKRTSLTTKSMWIQGIIVLGFVIYHLMTFKYGAYYETQINGVAMRDLFKLVNEVFHDPLMVGWYIVALLILCFHLSHGLYSSLQTLGMNHPKYTPRVKCISVGYGLLVSFAFISQPIFIYFFYQG